MSNPRLRRRTSWPRRGDGPSPLPSPLAAAVTARARAGHEQGTSRARAGHEQGTSRARAGHEQVTSRSREGSGMSQDSQESTMAGVTISPAGLKRTPLFDIHRDLGARLVEFGGWEMPVQYSGILEEHKAVRERAGLFDVSHMGEFLVSGPGALDFLQAMVPNNVA